MKKRLAVILLIVSSISAVAILVALGFASANHQNLITSAGAVSIPTAVNSPSPKRQCAIGIDCNALNKETADAYVDDKLLTIKARYTPPQITQRPIPTIEERYLAEAKTVKKLSIEGVGALRGVSSIWSVGAISNKDKTVLYWIEIIAYKAAGTANARINANVGLGENASQEDHTIVDKYLKNWFCPRPIGDIYITNITAPLLEGKAYFTSTSGVKGNLDFTTGVWSFDS